MFIRSVGCEVIFVAKAGFNANMPEFSPNGQSILAMGAYRAAGYATQQLLLFSVACHSFTLLQLHPETSMILPGGAAWSPNSKSVLCAMTLTHAQRDKRLRLAAVDAASAAVTYQHINVSGVCSSSAGALQAILPWLASICEIRLQWCACAWLWAAL